MGLECFISPNDTVAFLVVYVESGVPLSLDEIPNVLCDGALSFLAYFNQFRPKRYRLKGFYIAGLENMILSSTGKL